MLNVAAAAEKLAGLQRSSPQIQLFFKFKVTSHSLIIWFVFLELMTPHAAYIKYIITAVMLGVV